MEFDTDTVMNRIRDLDPAILEDAIRTMVDNDYITTRYTGLCRRLQDQSTPAPPQPGFD